MFMTPIAFYSFDLTAYGDSNLGLTLFTFQFMVISNGAAEPSYATGHLKLTSVCILHKWQSGTQQ